MSRLPDQELPVDGTMSASDAQHLIAREVMKYRMDDLQAKFAAMETSMTTMFAKIEAQLQNIQSGMSKRGDDLRAELGECKREVEEGIGGTYATKLELEKLEGKFNVFAAKIIAGTSIAMIFIQFGFQVWGK